MLMIEDLVTGKLTNFSPMTIEQSINQLKNQERLHDEMISLFENISPADRFVIQGTFQKPLDAINEHQLSTISTGMVYLASKELEFADHGSDYVSLSLIKKAYEQFDDTILSEKGQALLNKYDLQPSQLTAFDSIELMDNIKNSQQNLSVHYLTKKTNTFMIHALPAFKPEANSPLSGANSRKDKIEILRSVNPEISCSTFKSGTSHLGQDFGETSIGVIISSGVVKMASSRDMGSIVDINGERHAVGKHDISQSNIESIFNNRLSGNRYNEIVVKNPVLAGVYINLDNQTNEDKDYTFAERETPEHLIKVMENLKNMARDDFKNLPIFTIYKGEIRESSLNIKALSNFLPDDLKNDVTKCIDDNYCEQFTDEDIMKRNEWKTLTNDEFVAIAYERGDILKHEDLHYKGQSNELTSLRKLEILDKHQHTLKNDLSTFKTHDRRLDNIDEYLNINTSALDNLKHQKSVEYLPSYQHRYNNKLK